MIEWYWIIGGALAGWTFLNILSREWQTKIQELDAKRAADLAAKQAEQAAAHPPTGKEAVTVLR